MNGTTIIVGPTGHLTIPAAITHAAGLTPRTMVGCGLVETAIGPHKLLIRPIERLLGAAAQELGCTEVLSQTVRKDGTIPGAAEAKEHLPVAAGDQVKVFITTGQVTLLARKATRP